MKLVWMPQWFCQNYDLDAGNGHGKKCPYCPYGYRHGKLVFEDRETASNSLADPEAAVGFFQTNASAFGRFLEISGGEPLLYPHLDRVLGSLPDWSWAITSNTLNDCMIRRLGEVGALTRCVSWAASYHPLAGTDEQFAGNIRLMQELGVAFIHSTLTVSVHTIDRLRESVDFIVRLRVNAFQFHLDSHGDVSKNTLLREHLAREFPQVQQLAGVVPVHIVCNQHGVLLCLGADGTLYPCVSKAYQNLDPICRIDAGTRIEDLPVKVEYCGTPCFAVCDHPKHIKVLSEGQKAQQESSDLIQITV